MGMIMPLLEGNRWTGEWSTREVEPYTAPTLYSLRGGTRYHIVSDAQLARDLRPRTLRDVYRDNRAGRSECRNEKYVPKRDVTVWNGKEYVTQAEGGLHAVDRVRQSTREEYLAWCAARNHTPHPASLDRSHPLHGTQIDRCPKPEKVETAG